MPPRRQVDSLEQLCFMVLASGIHKRCVEIEENSYEESLMETKTFLSTMISQLPGRINEKMIIKVIDTIHQTIKRTRRTIGLLLCLEVLLQPRVQKLDLSGLFFKMRISGDINGGIRDVVLSRISSMVHLTSISMVSKCSDDILHAVSLHCKDIEEIVVTLSELVTDNGIEAVSNKCKKLEKLGIYKCWEITPKGIETALVQAPNLKELQSDQLGSVLIKKFKNTDKKFYLTHFEQTHTVFNSTEAELKWVGNSCQNLESVRIFAEDSTLRYVHNLGNIKILEIETSSALGSGFVNAVNNLGGFLVTLQLNCDSLNQEQLTTVGEKCTSLSTLCITTATIEDDDKLQNTGNYFPALKTLYLQVWKETVINVECIEFFLLHCYGLVNIVLKAEMEFLTDQYFKNLLQLNPLQCLSRLVLASDKFVPLTVASVNLIMNNCPALESLGISSWDISEDEFFQIRNDIKTNNLNFIIT